MSALGAANANPNPVTTAAGQSQQAARRSHRRNEVALEIDPGAVSDQAILGLLDDWIVPMVVARMIESITSSASSGVLRGSGYCEHDNCRRTAHDDTKPEGGSATQARPSEADPAPATVADGGGA